MRNVGYDVCSLEVPRGSPIFFGGVDKNIVPDHLEEQLIILNGFAQL